MLGLLHQFARDGVSSAIGFRSQLLPVLLSLSFFSLLLRNATNSQLHRGITSEHSCGIPPTSSMWLALAETLQVLADTVNNHGCPKNLAPNPRPTRA
jgi:hypothetical protein